MQNVRVPRGTTVVGAGGLGARHPRASLPPGLAVLLVGLGLTIGGPAGAEEDKPAPTKAESTESENEPDPELGSPSAGAGSSRGAPG